MEPTKRRRWNSAKGEGDPRGLDKEVKPFESQEPVPSSVAIAPPSAKVQTPKSAPPEKVAITRTAPTRAESTVNEENQKTRVGKLPLVCVPGAGFVCSLLMCEHWMIFIVMEYFWSINLL